MTTFNNCLVNRCFGGGDNLFDNTADVNKNDNITNPSKIVSQEK